jgi:hypothetical protein
MMIFHFIRYETEHIHGRASVSVRNQEFRGIHTCLITINLMRYDPKR